ncbi:hypothetical protein HpBTM53_09290 [Helicobacter pylori]
MTNITPSYFRLPLGEILYRIGIAYKEGLGVRKQKNRGKKFLQKSAEFGYEKASSVVCNQTTKL